MFFFFMQEGHRPDRIVSPSLRVGGNLQPNASNGKTQVFMNGRELGKLELKMLKVRNQFFLSSFSFPFANIRQIIARDN